MDSSYIHNSFIIAYVFNGGNENYGQFLNFLEPIEKMKHSMNTKT